MCTQTRTKLTCRSPYLLGAAPKILVRCDSAGATHAFAVRVGFSFGYAVDTGVQDPIGVNHGRLAITKQVQQGRASRRGHPATGTARL